jgi:lipopolysaccharide/colanic/teichoic acid biosynthesis glycosyltransferase
MTSKVVELARKSAPSKRMLFRGDSGTPASRLVAGGHHLGAAKVMFAEPSAARNLPGYAQPFNNFLKDLHRERRRAERSGAPLSLLLFRVNEKSADGSNEAEQLLELLHGAKRVTDFVGHVGDDMVAVLCPDTDAEGITGFMKKIEAQARHLPFAGVPATYPDDLFDNLANGTRTPPVFQPFLASDAGDRRERAYPLKRALDIVGALVALCLLGLPMLAVAAAVALTSRGPVIFKQVRVGKGGYPFTFYKFRSMVTNSDDSIHRAYVANLIKKGEGEGPAAAGEPATYKMQADPRVTPIGRFIRKTSIDELPQLFNVLKGDMSLVGPRPPIPYEAAQYQPWHLRRLMTLKPGMTGIWQVEGRSKVPFNDMVRMDLRYIRECSLALDLKILLKTVVVVFRGDGAD